MVLNTKTGLFGVIVLGASASVALGQFGDERFTLRPAHDGVKRVYGSSIDMNGPVCVIGSPEANVVDACGQAYVFDFSGTDSEVPLLRLKFDCDASINERFGRSVGVSPAAVIVGAPSTGALPGKAYVFDPDTGELVQELEAPEPFPTQAFGTDVDVSSAVAVVGAPAGALSDDPEAAYMYTTTDGALIATLEPGDGATEIDFGYSVAIHGNVVAIGAPLDDEAGSNSGAVYLFDITDPTAPVQTAKLLLPTPQSNAWFGVSVDTDSEYVLAGAFQYDTAGGANAGAAFLFDAETGAHVATLEGSGSGESDRLGGSVAIGGGQAILGYSWQYGSADPVGGAYVYDVSTPSSPIELHRLVPDQAETDDAVGYAVGVGWGVAVVGAVGDDDNGADRGMAFRFDPVTGEQTAQLWPLGGFQLFGSAMDQSAVVQIVGAPYNAGVGSVRFYCPVTGEQFSVLHSPSGESGGHFGRSVAVAGQLAAIASDAEGGSIYLVDVSDPRSPVVTGQISGIGISSDIVMNTNNVFATTYRTFRSYQIVPGGFFQADSIEVGEVYRAELDISTDGDLVAIGSTDFNRALTVDVSDPTSLSIGFELERVGSADLDDEFGRYGSAIAVSEHLVAVGSANETPPSGEEDQGMVWLFARSTGVCLGYLTEPGGDDLGEFGVSIDIYADTLVIGADPRLSVPDFPSEVHIYDLFGGVTPVYQGLIDSPDYPPPGTLPPAYDSFGSTLDLSPTGFMVGASGRSLVRDGALLDDGNGTVTVFGVWPDLVVGDLVAWPAFAGFSPNAANATAATGLPDLTPAVLAGPGAGLLVYGFEPMSPYAPGQLASAFGVPPGALDPYDMIVIGRSKQPGSTFETCSITVSDGSATQSFDVVYAANGPTQGPGWVSVPSNGSVANAAMGSQLPVGLDVSLLLLDLGSVMPLEGNLSVSIERPGTGQGGAFDSPEVLGVGVMGVSPRPCSVGDVAQPFDQLNFFDVAAFVSLFSAGDPAADLADPIGELNFFDLARYLDYYQAGCP
tara:strand:- start:8871 stop:11927 length:3057 start_codon:yes stop_codon:yes gene_type:complete